MQKNTSFIDILKGISTAQQIPSLLTQQQQQQRTSQNIIKAFPHCQSLQLLTIPEQKNKKLKPQLKSSNQQKQTIQAYTSPIKQCSKSKNKQFRLGMHSKTTINSLHSPSLSRSDQILFQIKLKLATFITKFNIDPKCLSNIREQSIENVLDLVFKKFKQYTKQHQLLVKTHSQLIKCKDIQIYNLQTKLSNLEQIRCQQSNRWNKNKDKMKQQQNKFHNNVQNLQIQNQQLRQNIYMLETIIKQQNQYINVCENQKNNQLQAQIIQLKSQISTINKKYETLVQEFQQKELGLIEQNQKLNNQINQIMQQIKKYKNQNYAMKQNEQILKNQLQNNQQKLINFYERLQNQLTISHQLKTKIEQLQQHKTQLTQQKQILNKQILQLNKKSQLKQLQIKKLNKTVTQIVDSYRNRGLPRKTKSIGPEQNYTIIVNPQKTKQDQYKNMNILLTKELQKQKQLYQIQKSKNQQQIKKVIQQWKQQMQKTVQFYQNSIQEMEINLSQKQKIIIQLTNKMKVKQKSVKWATQISA